MTTTRAPSQQWLPQCAPGAVSPLSLEAIRTTHAGHAFCLTGIIMLMQDARHSVQTREEVEMQLMEALLFVRLMLDQQRARLALAALPPPPPPPSTAPTTDPSRASTSSLESTTSSPSTTPSPCSHECSGQAAPARAHGPHKGAGAARIQPASSMREDVNASCSWKQQEGTTEQITGSGGAQPNTPLSQEPPHPYRISWERKGNLYYNHANGHTATHLPLGNIYMEQF